MDYDQSIEPTKGRRWLWGLVLAVLCFALGVAATAYGVNHWRQLSALLVRPDRTALVVAATPAAQRRDTVAAVVPAAQAAALDTRVARLETEVDGIDARARAASGNAERAEGMLIAFAARRALDSGVPLGYIGGLLRERFGGGQPQAVATILSAASEPVTLDELQSDFETIAPALSGPQANENWWEGMRRELASLIVVRRADTPSMVPGARVDRARRQIAAGRVDEALAEVARLPRSDAAMAWMASARRYVLTRLALDRIETAALLQPHAAPQE